MKMQLNILQQDITQGVYLIEASAGTGKTYNIQHLFLRLLLERPDIQQIRDILVVTFTELATAELKDRIRDNLFKAVTLLEDKYLMDRFGGNNLFSEDYDQIIKNTNTDPNLLKILLQATHGQEKIRRALQQKLQLALHSFDEASIFTIHGFCHRILKEHAFEAGSLFECQFVHDQADLLQEAVQDFWRQHCYDLDPILIAVARSLNLNFTSLLPLADLFVRNPKLQPLPNQAQKATEQLPTIWDDIKKTWNQERETILQTLLNTRNKLGRGKKNGYPQDKILTDAQVLDTMDQDTPYPGVLYDYAQDVLDAAVTPAQKEKGIKALPHPFFELCQEFRELAETFALKVKLNLKDYLIKDKALDQIKQKYKLPSFDDLLFKVASALGRQDNAKGPATRLAQQIRNQYKAALIDEFQDTDPIQYDIFQTLFDHKGHLLFLIGDPKQSIYSFRGADIFAYLSVAKKEHVSTRNLKTNYRSSPQIVQAVNTLFQRQDKPPFLFDQIRYEPVTSGRSPEFKLVINDQEPASALTLYWLPENNGQLYSKKQATEHIHGYVANKIAQILTLAQQGQARFASLDSSCRPDHPIRPQDIAVLTITNRQALELQQYLRDTGVPAVLQNSGNLFETQEAAEVFRALQAILRPNHTRTVVTALSTALFGLDAATLARYTVDDQAEAEYNLWVKWFSKYRQEWLDHGFMPMFTSFFAPEYACHQDMPYGQRQWLTSLQEQHPQLQKDVALNLMRLPDGERRLTNVRHLMEVLHQEELQQGLSPERLLRWLARRIEAPEEAMEHELRLEKDSEAVQILTVHKSKGLEFPIVFCPYLWTSTTHPNPQFQDRAYTFHLGNEDLSPTQYLPLDRHHFKAHMPSRDKEKLAENLRLLYVALTRAKHKTNLFWGDIKNTSDTALGYLLSENYFLPEDETINKTLIQDLQYTYHPEPSNPLMDSCDWPNDLHIPHDWTLMSFTSLVRHGKAVQEFPSKSADEPPIAPPFVQELDLADAQKPPFIDFPAGRQTGEAIHDLLYELDFPRLCHDNLLQEDREGYPDELITNKLIQYGIVSLSQAGDQDTKTHCQPYLSQVRDMLSKILITPFTTDQGAPIVLNASSNRYAKEMRFYFELSRPLDIEALNNLLASLGQKDASLDNKTNNSLEVLSMSLCKHQGHQHGLMTGSIDLVLWSDHRYYIADWKTNFLGNDLNNYSPAAIRQDMQANGYYLQYLIYTLALHRFLQQRCGQDYDYGRNFGGVFYLYLRGINGQDDSTGVFFDRLDHNLLSELDHIL
jgi:exodeoxyribonuclease V beta subunit